MPQNESGKVLAVHLLRIEYELIFVTSTGLDAALGGRVNLWWRLGSLPHSN
jgi:hypothetical protein